MSRLLLLISVALVFSGTAAGAGDWEDCVATRDPDESIRACTRVIEQGQLGNNNLSIAYKFRGWHYSRKKQLDQAITDVSEAIRLNPADGRAFFDRAYYQFRQARYDQAVDDYRESMRLDPKRADIATSLADAYRF